MGLDHSWENRQKGSFHIQKSSRRHLNSCWAYLIICMFLERKGPLVEILRSPPPCHPLLVIVYVPLPHSMFLLATLCKVLD